MKYILYILFFGALASCSPSRQTMESKAEQFNLPHTPAQGMGTVYIIRPSVISMFEPLRVYVDNKNYSVGYTMTKQYIYILILNLGSTQFFLSQYFGEVLQLQ